MFYVDVLFIIYPMLVDIENCRYSFVCPNGTVFSQERLVGPKSINLYKLYLLHTYNHITFHGNPIQGDFSIYTAPRSLKCKVTKINV